MSLIINESNGPAGIVALELHGALDSDNSPLLEKYLSSAITSSVYMVAFNMAGVTFVSSAGLRVIFKTVKEMKSRGGQVSVTRLRPGVRKVFDIVKVLPDLTVFASQAEMDEYLEAIQRREQN